jgi:hypothetical protein
MPAAIFRHSTAFERGSEGAACAVVKGRKKRTQNARGKRVLLWDFICDAPGNGWGSSEIREAFQAMWEKIWQSLGDVSIRAGVASYRGMIKRPG